MSADPDKMTLTQAETFALGLLAELGTPADPTVDARILEHTKGKLAIAERKTYPTCCNAVVAGSIRRQSSHCKDVELVYVPRTEKRTVQAPGDLFSREVTVNLVDEALDRLIAEGRAVRGDRWGEKWKRLILVGKTRRVGVDLFSADGDNFGHILTIRTGGALFSKAYVMGLDLRGYSSREGRVYSNDPKWAKYGAVPTPHERDAFTHSGLPWVPVMARSARDGETLQEAAHRWGFW